MKTKGDRLEGVVCEDFWPDVERRRGWLRDGPELSEWVMNEGDRGLFGGADVPASAKEIDLIVRVDPTLQMESQMQIQEP